MGVEPTSANAAYRPVRGDRVRVAKGAYIRTTHPNGDYLLSRSQVITVHHTLGWGTNPVTVCWPGSGGYWRESFEWEPVATGDSADLGAEADRG